MIRWLLFALAVFTLTGRAYARSALTAARVGPFEAYELNREPMLRVIGKHREAAHDLRIRTLEPANLITKASADSFQGSKVPGFVALVDAACDAWDDALEEGERSGFRNAQASVLAPTGTI